MFAGKSDRTRNTRGRGGGGQVNLRRILTPQIGYGRRGWVG